MFDGMLERRAGLTKNVAGIEQAIDLRSVPRSLLDLVEIVQVGDQRVGGLLVEVNVVGLRIGHGPIIDPTEPLLRGSLVRFPRLVATICATRAAGARRSRQLRLYQLGLAAATRTCLIAGKASASRS